MDSETPRFAAVRKLQLCHQAHIDLVGLRERHDPLTLDAVEFGAGAGFGTDGDDVGASVIV